MSNQEEQEEFLAACKESGDRAYGLLKAVLQRLENVETRVEARIFLDRLEARVNAELPNSDSLNEFHFRIHELSLTDFEGATRTITLLRTFF